MLSKEYIKDIILFMVNNFIIDLKESQELIKVLELSKDENIKTLFLSQTDLKDLRLAYILKKDNMFKYQDCYINLEKVKIKLGTSLKGNALILVVLEHDSTSSLLLYNKAIKDIFLNKQRIISNNICNLPFSKEEKQILKALSNKKVQYEPLSIIEVKNIIKDYQWLVELVQSTYDTLLESLYIDLEDEELKKLKKIKLGYFVRHYEQIDIILKKDTRDFSKLSIKDKSMLKSLKALENSYLEKIQFYQELLTKKELQKIEQEKKVFESYLNDRIDFYDDYDLYNNYILSKELDY